MKKVLKHKVEHKQKFEPYGDLVDQDFSQYDENLIKNQDPQNQIKNNEPSVYAQNIIRR